MRLHVALFVLLVPAIAAADGLTDLRATLGRLPGTTPVRGTLDVTSTSRSNEDDKAYDGKASVGFEIGESGLHIIYPRTMLIQATQEARAETRYESNDKSDGLGQHSTSRTLEIVRLE